jgi:hypothetical protein
MISVLAPSTALSHEEHLQGLIATGTLQPFDPLVVEFIDAVSKGILLDDVMCRMAEMAAVAHWMRRGHILELKQAFGAKQGTRIWLARGVALHFAPSNVDSIFLYSWFLSMLVGNANIVRLSQRRGEEIGLLLNKINSVILQGKFRPILVRNLILAYDHQDEVTEALSQSCQLRVIWGGDESVRRLRAIPMNPCGVEVVFASRFSLAVIGSSAILTADEEQLTRVAELFCNDAYWFDQMACSSPRLVAWVGERLQCEEAKKLFWPRVQAEIAKRSLNYPEVVGINKLVTAYVTAGLGMSDAIESNPTGTVSRVHLAPNAAPTFRNLECGGGLFFEVEVPHLKNLPGLLNERDQTLSYFGFTPEEMRALASLLPARAIDRIVPIGSALSFGTVWDGMDLLQTFSREIDLAYEINPRRAIAGS